MEHYKKLITACGLLSLLSFYDADGAVTAWASVTAGTAADTVVSTALVSATVANSAPGTAGVTFRDGLTISDSTLVTVQATSANTLAYTLDTPSLATFDLVSGSGVMTVKTAVTLSYSATSTYTVSITATDATASDAGVLVLSVLVNGKPTFSATPICLNIADATDAGTTLYTYTIADPDTPTTTVTTTLSVGNGDAYFTSPIVSGNLITAKAMAKATVDLFTLTIQAVDAGTPPSTATATFVVPVLDAGTGTGLCSSSGGTVVIGSVMTTMALLVTYFL